MKSRFVFLALLATALILSACASTSSVTQGSAIEVSSPWVRAVMDGMDSSSALFMVITNNGTVADTLIKVETDAADMSQIHISEVDVSGVSSMHEVDGIDIPVGGSVELKSGGYHVMLMGLKGELKEGDMMTFTLTFKTSGALTIEAPVKQP